MIVFYNILKREKLFDFSILQITFPSKNTMLQALHTSTWQEFLRRIFKDNCIILENSKEFLRLLENSCHVGVYKVCNLVFYCKCDL